MKQRPQIFEDPWKIRQVWINLGSEIFAAELFPLLGRRLRMIAMAGAVA
jgi:hypothetical protein